MSRFIFSRARGFSRVFLTAALSVFFPVAGCGPSAMMKKFEQASGKQYDLDHSTLSLWERSPTADSGDFLLTSASDLEQVPRASVEFSELIDQKGPLVSEDMLVVESSVSPLSSVFYSWAGRRVPWNTTDFSLLMAFHHASKALALAKRVLPDARYDFESDARSGKQNSRKLVIYADEIDDPFKTGYSPGYKKISFYKDSSSQYMPLYNPVLEGDAIYHEMAHYVMQAYVCIDEDVYCTENNLPAALPGIVDDAQSNPDMDALQEGLADYFAAVVAGDDRTLTFFTNNVRYLVSSQNRTGVTFSRLVNNRAKFPEAFRQEPHFDGRVVAGALNDFRRYLDGTGFVAADCAPVDTSSDCRINGSTNPMKRKAAEEFVLRLAFDAFRSMTTSSSLTDYASALNDLCVAECSAIDQIPGALALFKALKARGLLPEYDAVPVGTNLRFSDAEETADLLVYPALKWRPYPDNGNAADLDAYLEPCELVMVYPDLENLSLASEVGRRPLQVHNLTASLVEATGFKEVVLKKNVLDPFNDKSGNVSVKLLGWLNPGDRLSDLIGDTESRFYTNIAQSTFTRPLGKDFNVPSAGWLVHAPSDLGLSGTMKLHFSGSIYNAEEGGEVIEASQDFTLNLSTVTADEAARISQTKPNQITSFPCTLPTGSN